MNIRAEALVALLFAAAVTLAATASVAAMTVFDPAPVRLRVVIDEGWRTDDAFSTSVPRPSTERGAVLSGTPAPTPAPATEVAGTGSNYPGTAGWMGQATVAMPGDLGGQYNGEVNGHVTVCADRCARLPVVTGANATGAPMISASSTSRTPPGHSCPTRRWPTA